MLESLWIGALVVEFIYNCFILWINVNDFELQYINVVDIYVHSLDQWQRSRAEIKNELLQIYSLRYNSLNYQKKINDIELIMLYK